MDQSKKTCGSYESVKALVFTNADPHIIQLMVQAGMVSVEDWDKAIDAAVEFDATMEEMEARWRASLPTQKERIAGFVDSGELSAEKVESMHRQYILDRYEESLRNGGDEKERMKLATEFRYRYEGKALSPDQIEQARQVPLEKFIEVKRGFARCPFHNEKTASLHITKNLYHCFGCTKSGNSITYCIEAQGMSFKQAVAYLLSL